MTSSMISKASILSKLCAQSCLDLRQLAALHGVDAANETLFSIVAELRRSGQITRIRGRGARTSFVAASFDSSASQG